MNKNILIKHIKEFFGNKFIYRFVIWSIGIFIFSLGLNFIVHSGVGQDTYDAFFNPIRIALGVDISHLGTWILLPGGTILVVISTLLHFRRTKKIRIDYVLAVLPLLFSSFIIDGLGKIEFFQTMDKRSWVDSKWVYTSYPMHILWVCIGVPLLYFGIGLFSGTRVMPNAYAILVFELSMKFKKSFTTAQFFTDITFIFIGTVIMIINAATGREAGSVSTTWFDLVKVISLGTVVAVVLQGIIVGKTMMKLEKLFNYI